MRIQNGKRTFQPHNAHGAAGKPLCLFRGAVRRMVRCYHINRSVRNALKQRGGVLAKGRLLGVQFLAFLKDDLWLALARHADDAAKELARALREKGYPFYAEPYTNQLFPILPDEKIRELERDFSFELNAKVDETHTAVRFVTSWATSQETLEALVRAL